jgi:hypothetical protein
MPIELTCPGCGKQLRLADEHAGKSGRCPACQATFQIPTAGEQAGAVFGAGAPAQPFGSPPSPAGNLFGEQQPPSQPPNPFASTSSMQSPYGGTNPYSSSQAPMYGAPPASSGEGAMTASIVLGIVSIVFSFVPCCCLNLLISVPCGIIGLILSFQVPPERRTIGMILNIIGLGLTVLIFVGWLLLTMLGGVANQAQPPLNF